MILEVLETCQLFTDVYICMCIYINRHAGIIYTIYDVRYHILNILLQNTGNISNRKGLFLIYNHFIDDVMIF